MRCGDVVLVDYPFTDRTGSKRRPALVVSSDEFNKGEDVVIVPISSVYRGDDPFSYSIKNTAPHFPQTGLRGSSYVKWTKPVTIAKNVIRRRLGQLPRPILAEVHSRICSWFQS